MAMEMAVARHSKNEVGGPIAKFEKKNSIAPACGVTKPFR
jgi:hypothetical protein